MTCYFLNVYSPCTLVDKRTLCLDIVNWKNKLESGESFVGETLILLGIGWRGRLEMIEP